MESASSTFEYFAARASIIIIIIISSGRRRVRFPEMIDAFLGHVSNVLSGPNDFKGANNSELLTSLTTAGMLSKIHRIRMNDLNQLHVLYTALERHRNVRV